MEPYNIKMNNFKVTLWMHTSMTRQDVCDSIEEVLPSASYVVEDQDADDTVRIRPTVSLGPGMQTVEVRDGML